MAGTNTANILEIGADLAPTDPAADFNRPLGTSGATVNLRGASISPGTGMGFAAFGGPRTVNIGGAGVMIQYDNAGATMPRNNGDFLGFGSLTSNDQVIFINAIDFNSSASERRLRTYHGNSAVPEVKFLGVLSNSNTGNGKLTLDGTGGMIFANAGNTLKFALGVFVSSGNLFVGTNDATNGTNGSALGPATNLLTVGDANTGTNFAGFMTYGSNGGITGSPTLTSARTVTVSTNGAGLVTLGGGSADTTQFTGNIALGRSVNIQAMANGRFEYNPTAGKAMSGAGGISKTGAGLVVLNPQAGAYPYSGSTAVSEGILQVNASITGTGPVSVNNGGTLAGTGMVAGAATVNSGGVVAPGTGGAGTFHFSNLTVSSGAILNFDLDTPGVNSDLVTAANLTLTGGILNINNLGGFGPGTYAIIDYLGTFTGAASNLSLGTAPGGFFYGISNNLGNTVIELNVGTSPQWNVNGGGNYSDSSNWIGGVPHNPSPAPGGGAVANFGRVFTGLFTASINMDQAATVGTINFDNSNSYSISGSSALTLNNASTSASNLASINVNVSGSNVGAHTIATPLIFADNANVNVGAGSTLNLGATVTINSPFSVTVTGPGALHASAGGAIVNNGTLNLNGGSIALAAIDGSGAISVAAGMSVTVARVRQSALTLAAGSSFVMNTNGGPAGVSRLATLSIAGDAASAPSAKLDLRDNDLILDYTDTSPMATIRDQIKAAWNNGAWDGNGITSSVGNGSTLALGYAEAAVLFKSFPVTFSGQSGIDNTTVLVKYTRYGDANLTGVTDFVDLGILLNHFDRPGDWEDGDADFNGIVDMTDLGMLLNNFDSFPPEAPAIDAGDYRLSGEAIAALQQQGFTVVPEPGALGLLAATLLLPRRRRARPSV